MTALYQPRVAPVKPKRTSVGVKIVVGGVIVIVGLVWLVSCGALFNALGGAGAADTTDAAASAAPESDYGVSQQPTVQLGEKVRSEDYEFTATKVTCGVKRVGDQYFDEKAQGQFCMVRLRVTNVGKQPIHFSDENQALVDTKGRIYSADAEAWIYVDDSDPYGEINPGNTLHTTVPFDISKRAEPDYLLLKAGVWGFSEGVRVKL